MWVVMGEIVKAVGLKGDVKVLPSGDFDEGVLVSGFLQRWCRDETTVVARVERHRWKEQTVIVKLEGIDDRNEAEAVVGDELGFDEVDYDDPGFPRAEEPMPFVYRDLTVETTDGEHVGVVREVMVMPANLVLVVTREGKEDALIPVAPPVVASLRREQGILTIHPLPGLLDDEP